MNESLTVDAIAAAKGVQETSGLVRLAVYLEYYCCGDGDPIGQFRDTVGDGRSGACRAEAAIVAWEATACCKIDGQSKATGEVMERSSIYE